MFVLALNVVCVVLYISFLSLESFVITELTITELAVKFAKLQNSEYEYESRGGHQKVDNMYA